MKKKDYCDVCGRKKELRKVILANESGEGWYCKDCIKNNPHVREIETFCDGVAVNTKKSKSFLNVGLKKGDRIYPNGDIKRNGKIIVKGR